MKQTNILITNDDGIDSPGLRKLAEAAGRFGRVWVVAPDGQRSAMSHSFTYRASISVKQVDFGMEGVTAWSCDGKPADCVRLGALKLLPEKPDFVMAGINTGYNICHDVQYSATIGAVMEGALWGIHSIAFSQGDAAYQDVVGRYLVELMEECMNSPLEQGQVWSINFPSCALADCKGVKRECRVSMDTYYADHYEEVLPEDSEPSSEFLSGQEVRSFRLVPERIWKGSEGTDLGAVLDNYVAVGKVSNLC